VDLPEDKPVWKEGWFWSAMGFVGVMAVGPSSLAYRAYKKNTEAKDKAREDPEVQTSEQSVVITNRAKKVVL
jgi:hypothetical protein